MPKGRFVGVGVSEYDHGHVPLPHAVTDVRGLRKLLGEEFDGEPLCDPGRSTVSEHLDGVPGSLPDGGPLVVLWSGGGRISAGALWVLARDSKPGPAGGLAFGQQVVVPCAASGANQLLFLVDTCYAGEAVAGTDLAAAILREQPPDGGPMWVGVLASCLPEETARDGAFGQVLRRVLADGPDTPDLRVRWSAYNRYVRGDDVCDAVVKEWDGRAHTPDFQGRGNALPMFANPLFRPGAPERVVEHLLLAARGGVDSDRSWFTGRTDEMDKVVSWVGAGRPGVYVVTGSAGTGKSAIVGRVVSMADPDERNRLLTQSPRWEHADPGERAVHAHVHARGLTADRAAETLAGQLVHRDVLPAQDESRNAAELVGQVQRMVERGAAPPVVVIDGLDEARDQAFGIAEDLISRLSRHAVVIVSTREMPRGHGEPPGDGKPSGDGKLPLVATLAPAETIDLDDPAVVERGRDDLRRYLVTRLTGVSESMDPGRVAGHVAGTASMTGDRPFLLARLIGDQLRADPVDTSAHEWPARISASVEAAFDTDIARVAEPAERAGVPEVAEVAALSRWPGPAGVARARRLLTALTWAFGAGLPEDDWLTIADALPAEPGEPPGASPCDRDDLTWLLDRLGRYVVQDGEAGVAVYRLAHQTLADHLRPPYQPTHDHPFDPAALPVATALLTRYATLLTAGVDPTAPTYLWHHTHRHAATAGPPALDALRALAANHPALLPDVALAALPIADQFGHWGRLADAVAPTEEAVGLYRGLAESNPGFLPNLSGALNNLGVRYGEVGWRDDAVAPTEEAVGLYRGLAESNPGFVPDLASALNNLGVRYSGMGWRDDAVAPTEEAVGLYRGLADSNPAFLPDLAGALNNLGNHYGEVGRRAEAVAPAEEAVQLRRGLAGSNPAFLPDLASSLTNLDRHCAQVGEPDRAEAAWRATAAAVGDGAAAFLYASRARAVDAGHPGAAQWLVEAARLAGDDRGLIGDIHAQARRHRDADPARFDAAWSEHAGAPVPAWLLVDPALLAAAQGWIATETYTGERDYLAAHPELLDPSADDAVAEALLAMGEKAAGRYASLREAARVDGVEAAYRPLLLTILAHEFVRADPAGQRALLAERHDDLLSDAVHDLLGELAEDDDTGAVSRATALLDLARLGEHGPVFDALAEPARFPGLLAGLAARPDPAALYPAAVVAYTAATTPAEHATAGFHLAVATAIAGDEQEAGTLLANARVLDPERSTSWIATLADLGRVHPEVLPRIPALTTPPATAEPSEEDS